MLRTAVVTLALLVAGCNSVPKFAPLGIDLEANLSIEDAKRVLGEPGTRIPYSGAFGVFKGYQYTFRSDASHDGVIRLVTSERDGKETVSKVEVPKPRSPHLLSEVKKAWGEPVSDGTNDDGTYYVRYNFDSSVPYKNGGKRSISVFIRTSGTNSDIISNILWL